MYFPVACTRHGLPVYTQHCSLPKLSRSRCPCEHHVPEQAGRTAAELAYPSSANDQATGMCRECGTATTASHSTDRSVVAALLSASVRSVVVVDRSTSFRSPIHSNSHGERGHLDKVVAAWPLFAAFRTRVPKIHGSRQAVVRAANELAACCG